MAEFDIPFDQIEAARKEGYTDRQIADHVGQMLGIADQIKTARKEGYSDADIVSYLAPPPKRDEKAEQPEKKPKGPATIGDDFERGLLQTRSDAQMLGASVAGARLADIEAAKAKADRGEFLSPIERERARQYDEAKANTQRQFGETVAGAIDNRKQADELPISPEYKAFKDAAQGGFMDGLKAFWKAPGSVMASMLAEGAVASAPAMGANVIGGVVGGPVGALTAGASVAAGQAYLQAYAGKVAELLAKQGVDINNKDAVMAALSNPEIADHIRSDAALSAIPQAAAAGGGMLIAGKTLAPSSLAARPVAQQAVNIPAQSAAQGLIAMAGEAGSSAIIGEDIEGGRLIAAGIGGASQAPLDVAAFGIGHTVSSIRGRKGAAETASPRPRTTEEVGASVMEQPSTDDAINVMRESLSQQEVDDAIVAYRGMGDEAADQQADILQLHRGMSDGQVQTDTAGNFYFEDGNGKVSRLQPWDGGERADTIPTALADSIRNVYGRMGLEVVFIDDANTRFDGAFDKSTGKIFLSTKPDRNGAQVAAHELGHALLETRVEGGTNLSDEVYTLIRDKLTEAGWDRARELFGKTAPKREAFAEGPDGDARHVAAIERHLVTEMGAELLSELPKLETFMPAVIDRVQTRYGADVAKSVLQNFLSNLRDSMNRLREFFFKPEAFGDSPPPPAQIQHYLTNMQEFFDAGVALYAERFGTQAERENAQLMGMRKRAERERMLQEFETPTTTQAMRAMPEGVPENQRVAQPSAAPDVTPQNLGTGESQNVQVAEPQRPSGPPLPPSYAEAVQKAATYRRWLGELDAQRRADAPESPEARALQAQIDSILGKVRGNEDRLTNVARDRLEAARTALDEVLNPVGDSPQMARVRAALEAEQARMADAAGVGTPSPGMERAVRPAPSRRAPRPRAPVEIRGEAIMQRPQEPIVPAPAEAVQAVPAPEAVAAPPAPEVRPAAPVEAAPADVRTPAPERAPFDPSLQRFDDLREKGTLTWEPPVEWQPSPEELSTARRLSRGWTPEVELRRPQSLSEFVRKNGGISMDTPEGGDMRAADLNRLPGLLRRQGVQADWMAQRARDAGYDFGRDTEYGGGVNVDAFLNALIEDGGGRKKHYPDNHDTEAWRQQQAHMAELHNYISDVIDLRPKDMDPRRIAWILRQEPEAAKTLALAERADRLSRGGSIELARRLDADRAQAERDMVPEPGAWEMADHRDLPSPTREEVERYHGEFQAVAGADRNGEPVAPQGRPASEIEAANRFLASTRPEGADASAEVSRAGSRGDNALVGDRLEPLYSPRLPGERPLLDTREATPEELAARQRQVDKVLAEANMRGRKVAGRPQESAEDLPIFGGQRQADMFGSEEPAPKPKQGTLFSPRVRDEADAAEITKRAKDLVGITSNPREAGYVTRDGQMLDMSGRHWDTSTYERRGDRFVPREGQRDWVRDQRQVDHRDVAQDVTEASGTEAMREFMDRSGAMRVDFNVGVVSASVVPSQFQIESVARAARRAGLDRLSVERVDGEGRTVSHAEVENITPRNLARVFNEPMQGEVLFSPRQTETPEFKRWFGDSKIKDEDGQPLRLYHGTRDSVQSFDLDHPNRKDTGWLGTGVYMTNSPSVANSYALLKRGAAGENVMPLYARMENPYRATMANKERFKLLALRDPEEARLAADAWTRELRAKGHDGVILEYPQRERAGGPPVSEYIVFDPAGVKSASGNRGTFDRANPDIAYSPRNPGPNAPGVGVADENKLGFVPSLRVKVNNPPPPPTSATGKAVPLITQATTNGNAPGQLAAIDTVLNKFPNATRNASEWARMQSYAFASDEVPVPPYAFLKNVNSIGAADRLKTLTPGQIEDANHGFDAGREFRRAYVAGELDAVTTGKLFMWSFLSRGVSPYTQEGLFIDAFKGADQWIRKAAEGKFTEADLPAYAEWASTAAPKGSGQPGAGSTHNLNAFGKSFLLKMSQPDASGVSRLQHLHNMMADPNMTGQQIRREFMRFGEGVGIDNKVVSFTLLVTGHTDVMVIDRVQTRQLWDDGRFADRNIYDGQKNAEGQVITGTPLANLTYGARGLLVYEAIERGLAGKIKDIYTSVGRPQDASIGRYHWESWVAYSQQEASHGTLDAILHDAKGDDTAIAKVTAKQGEYGAYEYGARYGRDVDGTPYFLYATPSGKEYGFSVPAFRSFLEEIKATGSAATRAVPANFKVTESGNAPWYNRPEVNRARIEERAAARSDRGTGADEGARTLREAGQGEDLAGGARALRGSAVPGEEAAGIRRLDVTREAMFSPRQVEGGRQPSPEDKGVWQGKRFWSGAFDTRDGQIMEVHPFKRAAAADFHHSYYFSDRAQEAMREGNAAFFWVDDKGIQTEWRQGKASNAIIDRIRQQIEPAEGSPSFSPRQYERREPAPTFYSAVERAVQNAKTEKAAPGQWLGTLKNMPGVKPEEVQWLGLEDWLKSQPKSVTKQEVLDYVRANKIEVREVMLGGEPVDQTQHRTRVLPGGKNYRELLFVLPESGATEGATKVKPGPDGEIRFPSQRAVEDFMTDIDNAGRAFANAEWGHEAERGHVVFFEGFSPKKRERFLEMARQYEGQVRWPGDTGPEKFFTNHWPDHSNVIAHTRFDDRTGPNGERILHVAEVQSDWHQTGRKRGYAVKAESGKVEPQEHGLWKVTYPDGTFSGGFGSREAAEGYAASRVERAGVPDAPFKTTWPELVLKRMIRYAAENGYDRISWDTGATNADRYDLSRHVAELRYAPPDADHPQGRLEGFDRDGKKKLERSVSQEELPGVVGKDAAEKLMASELREPQASKWDQYAAVPVKPRQYHFLAGDDLRVGGAGMSAFYDKQLPIIANKIGKKFGAEVEQGKIETAPAHFLEITDAMRRSVVEEGQPLFSPRVRAAGTDGYTDAQRQAAERVRGIEGRSLVDRIAEIRQNLGTKIVREIVDPYVGVKERDAAGYLALRNANSVTGAVDMFNTYGPLRFEGSTYATAGQTGGPVGLIRDLGADAVRFMDWVAANRAERLKAEDRENLYTGEDIKILKTLNQGQLEADYTLANGKTTRSREVAYLDALTRLDTINKNARDIAVESGLVKRDVVDALWSDPYYVPFYRQAEEDGSRRFVGSTPGMTSQTAGKALKGGSERLNQNLWQNAFGNWAHMIDASIRNKAANQVLMQAEADGIVGRVSAVDYDSKMTKAEKADVVWTMVDGEKQYWRVDDPMTLKAVSALDYVKTAGPFMDIARGAKKLLQTGVAASPLFQVRNLIRDTENSIAVSPISLNVFKNLADGATQIDVANSLKNVARAVRNRDLVQAGITKDTADAIAGGATMRYARGVDQSFTGADAYLDSPGKLAKFQRYFSRVAQASTEAMGAGENFNRLALYRQLGEGDAPLPHDVRAYQGRDLSDFTLIGASPVIRALVDVVPYMNAWMQGLYKVGRAAADADKNVSLAVGGRVAAQITTRLAVVMAGMTALNMALDAIYADDKDYQNRSEYDRNSNFWFKVGGTEFRIPMGFEVAALSRLSAIWLETLYDKNMTAGRAWKNTLQILGTQMAFNPTPQAVKPIIDLAMNESRTGAPIETAGMERLRPEFRATAQTTEVSKGLSEASNKAIRWVFGQNARGLSPVQMDYLAQAYAGWLGTSALQIADTAVRSVSDRPPGPATDWLEKVTGGMVSETPTSQKSGFYVNLLYQQGDAIQEAYNTFQDLAKRGRTAEAREYLEENRDLIKKYPIYSQTIRLEGEINQQIRTVTESKTLTPEQKRVRIMQLNAMKTRAAENVFRAVNQ